MKHKCFLHVGYPKTGTTSLQMNIFPLVKKIQYLGRKNSKHGTCNYKSGFAFDYDDITDIANPNISSAVSSRISQSIANAAESSDQNIFISEEAFFFSLLGCRGIEGDTRGPIPISVIASHIRKLLPAECFDLHLIATVRDQCRFISSIYAEKWKIYFRFHKETKDFAAYLRHLMSPDGAPFLNLLKYHQTLHSLADAVKAVDLSIIPLELLSADPGAVNQRFAAIFGDEAMEDITPDLYAIRDRGRNQGNGSYKVDGVTMRDLLRPARKAIGALGPQSLMRWVGGQLNRISVPGGKPPTNLCLSAEQEAFFKEFFAEDNQALSKQIGINLEEFNYF